MGEGGLSGSPKQVQLRCIWKDLHTSIIVIVMQLLQWSAIHLLVVNVILFSNPGQINETTLLWDLH